MVPCKGKCTNKQNHKTQREVCPKQNYNYLEVIDGNKTKGKVRERNILIIYVEIVRFFWSSSKNDFLILRLKVLTFVFDFTSAYKLSHNLGPKYERAFWPWMPLMYGNYWPSRVVFVAEWLVDLGYVRWRHVLEELKDIYGHCQLACHPGWSYLIMFRFYLVSFFFLKKMFISLWSTFPGLKSPVVSPWNNVIPVLLHETILDLMLYLIEGQEDMDMGGMATEHWLPKIRRSHVVILFESQRN